MQRAERINRGATGLYLDNRDTPQPLGFVASERLIDGVGLPNDWRNVTDAVDVFGYEKIQVICGAHALFTGIGDSSDIINFVRKRPTNDRQGVSALTPAMLRGFAFLGAAADRGGWRRRLRSSPSSAQVPRCTLYWRTGERVPSKYSN